MTEDDKKVIKDAMQEMVDSMTRVAAERDLQKHIIARVKEKTVVAPKVFRKMARTAFNANFSEEVAIHEEFELLYTQVAGA